MQTGLANLQYAVSVQSNLINISINIEITDWRNGKQYLLMFTQQENDN